MREIIDVNGMSHHNKHYYYYYHYYHYDHYYSGIVDPSLSESGAVNKALKEFVNVGDILVKLNGKLLEDTTLVEVAAWMKTMKENSIDRTLVFLKPRQVSLEAFLQKGIVISIPSLLSTVITHYSYLEYDINQAEGDRVYSIKSSMSTSAKKQQSSLSASTPTSAEEAEVNPSKEEFEMESLQSARSLVTIESTAHENFSLHTANLKGNIIDATTTVLITIYN